MERIFVYGTLKRGQPNNPLMCDPNNGEARYIASGRTVKPYPLVIASKFNVPYLLPEEGTGLNIRGDIYEIDQKMLHVLDEFEGHPTYYDRRRIAVEIDRSAESGAEVQYADCWCYFLLNAHEHLLQLPFISDYDTNGPHGRPYVLKYDRSPSDPPATSQVQRQG